ncbi:hypothetical protein WJX74_010977 [Apatococcus lobatus]|uniref:Glucosidase 2 subunit beta n=1 Tax=Apatococcus lobatus TaxID=904363 RepID=A0AAW1QML7_9CHLO
MDTTRYACLALLGMLCVAEAAPTLLRGIDPALAASYSPQQGSFTCLDGRSQISTDRLNDDYCDCIDGSDEPGTSACAVGHFFCRNRGHTSKRLNSSMVDDGVCDCCDGSDEQPGRCKNTCKEEGSVRRAELKAQAKAYALGFGKREGYVKEAVQKKADWTHELSGLDAQIKSEDASVKKLQDRKDAAEAAEKADRDREDARKAASSVPTPEPIIDQLAANQAVDESSGAGASDNVANDDYEAAGETVPEDEATTQEAVEGAAEEAGEAASSGKTEEEMAQERMAQWIKSDSPAPPPPPTPELQQLLEKARAAAKQFPAPQQTGEPSLQQDESRPDAQEQTSTEARPEQPEASAQQAEAEAAEAAAQAPAGWLGKTLDTLRGFVGLAPASPSEPGKLTALSAAATAARDKYNAAHNSLSEKQRRQSELQGLLNQDYGPDDAYLTLHARCFDTKADKYTYEMCLFGSAAQKDAHLHTGLGQWDGFKDGYSIASFTNGQHCWQGPPRSLQVSIKCGSIEQVSKVDEPNRCEYTAEFATPAACSPSLVEQAQRESTAAEQDLKGHDEL